MAARQTISGKRHILRALERWPKDPLRPEYQFQDIVRKRFEASPSPSTSTSTSTPTPNSTATPTPTPKMSEMDLLRQANALYSLLDNRYKKKYTIKGSIMHPRSNPTYYKDLLRELEEGPKRSWFDRLMLKIGGLVRF